MPYKPLLALSLSALLCCSLQAAEQAPIGIAAVTLDQATYDFDTAEQHGIRVRVLARELPRSFAMAFLPDGDLLISERGGNLRLLRDATGSNPVLADEPVAGVPALDPPYRNGGLHDLALHPDFPNNGWLYFTYNKGEDVAEGQQRRSAVTLMRGRYADGQLSEVEELFSGGYGSTSGSRIVFAQDGTLYMTTGAPFGNEAQVLDNVYGKVLRMNDDGSIPADNPFVGRADAHPAIFSLGHRDQLGLTEHPATGAILSVEHGPNGGDEVNLIQPGHNFGWPTVSFGRNYDGTPVAEGMVAEGVEPPLLLWVPSIGPSGLTFYTGDRYPAWQGNLFVGSARRGEVDRTGGLERVVLNENLQDLRRETLLTGLHQRIRDVRQGPDGLLYVLTDGDEFAVLRIEPYEPYEPYEPCC